MTSIIQWLLAVPGHSIVPLFEMESGMIVKTRLLGQNKRRVLARSPLMEATVIELIESGLKQESWTGMLYVMGVGNNEQFSPLYVGKAERRGRKNDLSANIANIRKNTHKFARWGDSLDYHIGDMSYELFGASVYRNPYKKYKKWVETIFESKEPPTLKQPVFLYVAPWTERSTGPSGLLGSLPAAEKEVVALACGSFPGLLNVDGI